MKKKLGDMTVREAAKATGGRCSGCPLDGAKTCALCEVDLEKEIAVDPLTPSEMAICRALGAEWVSLDNLSTYGRKVGIWDGKPTKAISGNEIDFFAGESMAKVFAYVDEKIFPSVKPGDLIYVGEGEEDD